MATHGQRHAGPGKRRSALLLIDFINTFEFSGGGRLGRRARSAAAAAAKLKARMQSRRLPCIYVNDNFGDWSRPFPQLVEDCLARGGDAQAVAELLRPSPGEPFILKPRHSAFYG